MAIDSVLYDRIVEIATGHGAFPGGSVLILGDCRFRTAWATGDNGADLAQFRRRHQLERAETADVYGAPTLRLDLHEPVPDALHGQFDLIIDAGTLYCCFDVAAVLRNCLAMLEERGTIIHQSALTGYFGRGYYNLHPALFKDFYEQNGFAVTNMEIRVHKAHSWQAKLQRLLSRANGRGFGQFTKIGTGDLFVDRASHVGMNFTPDTRGMAPMLPNDAMILCAAQRTGRREFVRPLPSFFRQQALTRN